MSNEAHPVNINRIAALADELCPDVCDAMTLLVDSLALYAVEKDFDMEGVILRLLTSVEAFREADEHVKGEGRIQ